MEKGHGLFFRLDFTKHMYQSLFSASVCLFNNPYNNPVKLILTFAFINDTIFFKGRNF